jgi:hypothetical protein
MFQQFKVLHCKIYIVLVFQFFDIGCFKLKPEGVPSRMTILLVSLQDVWAMRGDGDNGEGAARGDASVRASGTAQPGDDPGGAEGSADGQVSDQRQAPLASLRPKLQARLVRLMHMCLPCHRRRVTAGDYSCTYHVRVNKQTDPCLSRVIILVLHEKTMSALLILPLQFYIDLVTIFKS